MPPPTHPHQVHNLRRLAVLSLTTHTTTRTTHDTRSKPPFHGEHTFEIFEKILSAKVDMPAYFHPEAKDLIEKLLVVDVAKRLGGTRGGGAEEVMSHPWFAGIDWDALHKRQLRAPINPGITGEGTLTHHTHTHTHTRTHTHNTLAHAQLILGSR